MDTFVTLLTRFALSLPVDPPAPAPMTDQQSLDHLLQGLGGSSGAGALGMAIAVTQLVMFLARGPIGDLAGKWKLAIVTGVAVVATVLAGKLEGMTWLAALLSGPVVAAAQVFAHQLIGNFKPQPAPAVAVVPPPDKPAA